jgi:alpha-D-ribose 1-methylphosphonate 5-triphosphate synthase subunit PhnH
MSVALSAGFTDPVADAQRCFRAVLDAMARPGHLHKVRDLEPPPLLCGAAAAVLLTLVDHETPLWVDPSSDAVRGWIEFHCGAPIVENPFDAAFVLAVSTPDLTGLDSGTYEMPERSATVILTVDSLNKGDRYWLSGPGLRKPAALSVAGLPADFVEAWQRNHALFPRGIDLVLCAGDTLTALPRSVAIEKG